MSTNIFDFQNSESSMQFNPLFLPANTFVDNPGSIKSFKISNSSYLFSDIIKVFAGTSLVKNPDLKLSLPSDVTSKQIPAENIFSFNLADINNLPGFNNELNKGNGTSDSLKDIIALISQLFKAGQNNSLQEGISLTSNNSVNDKVLTSDGLKAFLNELNNLVNNTDVEVNSSKEKNATDKDTKEIISKIVNSLNNGGPVLINIIGKNETLKIELNKSGIEAVENKSGTINYKSNFINGLPNENKNYSNSDKLTNSEEIQDNKLTIPAEQTAQNSNEISTEQTTQNSNTISVEKTKQNSNIQSAAQTEQNSKTKVQFADTDKVEKLLPGLGGKETELLKDYKKFSAGTKNKAEIPDAKTISGKTAGSLKSLIGEQNSEGNDVYKLKFEIVDNGKNTQSIKNHHDLSNAPDLIKKSSVAVKSKSDSLTIENLVASKSSLKNINKFSNQTDNNSVKTDVKNIPDVKIEINNTTGETKNASKNSNPVSLNPKNDVQKSIKVENNNTNKFNSDNSGNQKVIINDTNLNTEVSKEIKVAGSDSQSIHHKETLSNSHLSENIKADNSVKISPNNSSENNLSDNLSGSQQELLNNSKGQDQISGDRGENAFSSYLNKIDANIIQNNNRPVNLNNLADQMKTIDSTEIVKEISKLASDKDQKNIVLKLMPESLGKVKILLDISNNIIHAHAEVENEAAKSLMQNNLGNLKQALAQQGMQLNSLNISLSNHQEQKSNKSYLSKRKFTYSEPQIGEIDENEHTNVSKHYGYNTYEFLA
ncbi:MAG: flagellar hook-length control protein FliK [Ignavibacteriaceae bacterium]